MDRPLTDQEIQEYRDGYIQAIYHCKDLRDALLSFHPELIDPINYCEIRVQMLDFIDYTAESLDTWCEIIGGPMEIEKIDG